MKVYSPLVKPYASNHKKRLGQHFLRDTGTIERIVRWMQPRPEDIYLEIGSGDGALSSRLAAGTRRLVAVEFDIDCIAKLEEALAPFESAIVIREDILRLDLIERLTPLLEPGTRFRVAGNLPYNIATAIIDRFLHSGLPVLDMIFMVQLEVAQRITAGPGTKKYGYLSVQCQHHCDVEMGFKVAPGCFVPRPRVHSAMVSLHPKKMDRDPDFERDFEALCKAAFSHRRKTLANSIGMHPRLGPVSSDLLKMTGIDGSRRAEDLSVAEFEVLARIYNKNLNNHTP